MMNFIFIFICSHGSALQPIALYMYWTLRLMLFVEPFEILTDVVYNLSCHVSQDPPSDFYGKIYVNGEKPKCYKILAPRVSDCVASIPRSTASATRYFGALGETTHRPLSVPALHHNGFLLLFTGKRKVPASPAPGNIWNTKVAEMKCKIEHSSGDH